MAVVASELPPPGPHAREIQFRRLLLQCERRAQREQAASGEADDAAACSTSAAAAAVASSSTGWRTDPKFHAVRAGGIWRHVCFVFELSAALYTDDGQQHKHTLSTSTCCRSSCTTSAAFIPSWR